MLSSIQKEIETTYQITCPFPVDEFLLDESECRAFLNEGPSLAFSQEVLLVHQKEDQVHVGLFFDPHLLEWSKNRNWKDIVGARCNVPLLAKTAPLIEGVSHFVYLLWRAGRDEPVTQLELELQAEVDKFILFSSPASPAEHDRLIDRLFHGVIWRGDLDSVQKERYETAVALASKYCRYLGHRFLKTNPAKTLLPEIRSFYRMSQSEKIRHIQQ